MTIAVAVLCANRQGKQWELRQAVFAQQDVCAAEGGPGIKDLAREAGLDMSAFDKCFDDNETGAELERYIQQGKDSRIYATPTFFVDGQALVGPQPVSEFEKLIEGGG